MKSVFKSE